MRTVSPAKATLPALSALDPTPSKILLLLPNVLPTPKTFPTVSSASLFSKGKGENPASPSCPCQQSSLKSESAWGLPLTSLGHTAGCSEPSPVFLSRCSCGRSTTPPSGRIQEQPLVLILPIIGQRNTLPPSLTFLHLAFGPHSPGGPHLHGSISFAGSSLSNPCRWEGPNGQPSDGICVPSALPPQGASWSCDLNTSPRDLHPRKHPAAVGWSVLGIAN